jgi:endonuclease/exonuclease/phosphatase family metal-dependent hydrolase
MDKKSQIFMSYNIFCGGFPNHYATLENPERLPKIKLAIEHVNPDFCTLIDSYAWDKIYNANDLKSMFHYPFAHSINLEDSRHQLLDSTGITVLTRLPVIQSKVIRIFSRNAIITTVKIGNQDVDVISVYLDFDDENIRLKQMKAIIDYIHLGTPTIITGDLNSIENYDHININFYLVKFVLTHPLFALELFSRYIDMAKNKVIPYIKQNGFKDADLKHIPTVPTKLLELPFPKPLLHVDYAFSRGNINLSDFQVPNEQIFDEASDHYPISFKVNPIS